jgi:hypothetical protein
MNEAVMEHKERQLVMVSFLKNHLARRSVLFVIGFITAWVFIH